MAANVLEADALHHSWSCDSNGWPLHLRLRLLPCQTNPTWTQVLWFLRIIPRIIEIETSTTKRKQSIFYFYFLSELVHFTDNGSGPESFQAPKCNSIQNETERDLHPHQLGSLYKVLVSFMLLLVWQL